MYKNNKNPYLNPYYNPNIIYNMQKINPYLNYDPMQINKYMNQLSNPYMYTKYFMDPSYLEYEINSDAPTNTDYGSKPYIVNIDRAAMENNNYLKTLWTGDILQLALMSIEPGGDIGFEAHPNSDQFIRIESGEGILEMGSSKDKIDFRENVQEGFAIIIPAGEWHNLTNTGNTPLKLYSIYSPPHHPPGIVHETREQANDANFHNHQ